MYRLALLAATALLAAAPAHADALQNQLLAAARAVRADAFAFRRTLTLESTNAPRKVIVEQFDPRRAPAQRWSLVSVDGRAPNAKELERARKGKHGKPASYFDLADWIAAPASRTDGPPGYVVYRYPRLPAGVLKIESHDASADTRAEALVNVKGKVPFVERVLLASTKGFRMMLVVSLKTMTITQRYRLLPDGQPVPADMASTIAGSMMGKAGSLKSSAAYTDVQRVR